MRLVSVVMGTDSERARKTENTKLLRYGFRFYETVKPYEAGHSFASHRIYMGNKETVSLGINQSAQMTIPRGQTDQLSAQVVLSEKLEAPIEKGKTVGTLTIELDGKSIMTFPLVTLEEVEEGGFFSQAMDWFTLQLGLEE